MNLRQKLAETADKQRERSTEIIIEDLRKFAFECASNGYKHMQYKIEQPINYETVKEHFEEQGVTITIDQLRNKITLSWFNE